MDKKMTEGQPRIFKNQFLESLTKTTPMTSVMVYGPVVIGLMYVSIYIKGLEASTAFGLFFLGLFFWTLAEYLLHRYLFHWVSDSKLVMRMHYIMHGVHHEHPKDEQRLLMPPVPGLLLGSILFGIFYFLFWLAGYHILNWAFFPGFFLGYLLYSFIHYSIHKYKPPKSLKWLWVHHSLHHYKYPDKAFGVSSALWDRVFGTMPPESTGQGEKTVKG